MTQPRYEWLYLYAFAHPNSGRSFYLLMPAVSIVAFSIALAEFATFAGASAQQQILILLDKAGWHVSPDVGDYCKKPRWGGLEKLFGNVLRNPITNDFKKWAFGFAVTLPLSLRNPLCRGDFQ